MEWLTGLALLPALVCGVMMGGMALAGVLGWRRTKTSPGGTDNDASVTTAPGTQSEATEAHDGTTLEDARR